MNLQACVRASICVNKQMCFLFLFFLCFHTHVWMYVSLRLRGFVCMRVCACAWFTAIPWNLAEFAYCSMRQLRFFFLFVLKFIAYHGAKNFTKTLPAPMASSNVSGSSSTANCFSSAGFADSSVDAAAKNGLKVSAQMASGIIDLNNIVECRKCLSVVFALIKYTTPNVGRLRQCDQLQLAQVF